MSIYKMILEKADDVTAEMTAFRRDFHRFAETGWLEMRTSSIIARRLTELGYEVIVGQQVCKRDDRMGVPSDKELEKAYMRAVEQGADAEFVKATEGGFLRCWIAAS